MTRDEQQARESSYIIRIGQHIELAQVETQAYYHEAFVKMGKKDLLKRVCNKLESAKNEMARLLSEESRAHLAEHVIDADTATLIQSVQHMLLDMPKGKRKEVEDYIIAQYNVYNLNKRP
jgi:hypothetical protein